MKIRKATILPIIVSVLLGVVMIGPVGASSTTIGVEPDSIVDLGLVPGSTFAVNITINDVTNLAGAEFKLAYNTLVLTATDITYGDIFGPYYSELINVIYDSAGYLHYGVMRTTGASSGSGLLATITFSVDSLGESPLNLYDTKLGDAAVPPNPIDHTVTDGSFLNTDEEIVYSATLVRRRAWPEKHDFYLWKEDEKRNDLFAIVKNDGTVGVMVKAVFTVTDGEGNPLGDWETDTIGLMPGEQFGYSKNARYFSPWPTPWPSIPPEVGKYYVSAICWADTNADGVPDTAMGKTKSFSFNVLP